MTISSTHAFILQNPNLVCKKPIAVSKVNLSPEFGSTEYEFKIHHLGFLINVTHSGIMNVFIKSDLIGDDVPVYTCMTKIKNNVVYHMLTLLEYNSKNFCNEHMFTNMMMLRIRFYVSGRFPEDVIYEAPTFRVVNNLEVGIIFKYADNAVRTGSAIGRVLRSMGTFNIAVLSALHMSTKNQVHRKNAEDVEFRTFEKNQTLLSISYGFCDNYKNRSYKDATYKARQKAILELLSYEELANLLDVSFIPYIGNCSSLSDIKLIFRLIKSTIPKSGAQMFNPNNDPTFTIVIKTLKDTPLPVEQKEVPCATKVANYLKVKDYMSTQQFRQSPAGDEVSLVPLSGLLKEMNKMDVFIKLATKKANDGFLKDRIDIDHFANYSKLVIRRAVKNNTFSIGRDKWNFKDYDQLCHFLSDIENLVSLFCIDEPQEKKTEQQVKLEEIKKYIDSKIVDVRTSRTYRSTFKMLDFLTDNHLWMDLNDKLQKMVDETPGMHLFNSVPESVSIEYGDGGTMEHTQDIYVSCSYNQQDDYFSPVRVFRDETVMLQWLMDPINLVKKFDKEGKLVKEKTEEKISRNVFDRGMNNFIRSTPSIPYSSCIVYHRLNLSDFALVVESMNGAKGKELKKLYDDSVINTNDYLLFIDLDFVGKEKKFRLVTPGNTIVIDWTSERETILSYLYDKYINR